MDYFKKTFLLLTVLLVAQASIAQNSPLSIKESDLLLLTKVCTSNQQVLIDGAFRTKGFRFTSKATIELNKGEYIKVTNLNTGMPDIRISGNDLIITKTSTIGTFIQVKKAGGKGSDNYGNFLERFPWFMAEDTLYIPTQFLLDNHHAFLLKTIHGNKYFSPIPYDKKTNELVLTKDYFIRNGIYLTPGIVLQFRVEYWEDHDKTKVLTDKFYLEYIPFFREK